MEIRKKLGTKKAEKFLEISAFLVFSRSDLNRPKDLAVAEGLDSRRELRALVARGRGRPPEVRSVPLVLQVLH